MYLYVPDKIKNPKRLALLIGLGAVFIMLAVVLGPRFYDRWQIHQLMKEAKSKLGAGQLREGITPLIKIISINPKNVVAQRMVSDAAEKLGAPDALDFREKALEIEPNSLEDAVRLTIGALAFEKIPIAEKGLALIRKHPEAPLGLLPGLQAQLALLQGNEREAGKQFVEALRHKPRDPDLLLNLAILQVDSGTDDERASARKILQEARNAPPFRLRALRGLLRDAIARKDSFDSFALADELVLEKKATFADRLERLSLLRESKDLAFKSYLETLQKEAAQSYLGMNQMVRWVARNDVPDEARDWVNRLPTQYLTKPPLAQSVAEVYAKMGNWQSLSDLTLGENWNDFDYARLAYLSMAQAQTGRREFSRDSWTQSLDLARGNLVRVQLLLTIAESQDWEDDRIDLLWQMADLSPTPADILQTLRDYHWEHRQTRLAWEACERLIKLGVAGPEIEADWLHLALLQGKIPERALAAAEENWRKNPGSSLDAARLALARLRQGRFPEAYFLLRNLPAAERSEPSVASYYGMAGAALGDPDAGRFLNLGLGLPLFPEEAVLVRAARRRLGQDWLPEAFALRAETILRQN